MDKYKINEIYSCIQGEGASVGVPSIIIRFQGCNLCCCWCDSKYAIDDGGGEISGIKEIIEKVKALKIKNIIFTGGEPCLQDFNEIAKRLDNDYTFEVESNATILPHEKLSGFTENDYFKYQWNLSPKGGNAGYGFPYEKLVFWSQMAKSYPKVFFKFVISEKRKKEDIEEVLECVKTLGLSTKRVYLMPEGNTFESQIYNEWLVNLCKKYNMNYCVRLHLLLHKQKKGV